MESTGLWGCPQLPAAARSLKIPFTYIVFRNCDILLCAQHTVWWMRRENRKWHVFAFAVQAISAVLLSILFVSEGFLKIHSIFQLFLQISTPQLFISNLNPNCLNVHIRYLRNLQQAKEIILFQNVYWYLFKYVHQLFWWSKFFCKFSTMY